MLLAAGAVAAVAYFAMPWHTRKAASLPELVLRVEGESLNLPGGKSCSLPREGCADALASLPQAEVRLVAPAGSPFAVATPVLRHAADHGLPALLDDGKGPVEVTPRRPDALQTWSDLHIDLPGVRLRIILRADGFWLAGANGKVLGADPRGPTLPPLASGQDFDGLDKRLALVKREFKETEDECALLPSLDTPFSDVVQAVAVAHHHFGTVQLAVP
jgi:hypothetical protein